MLDYVIGMPCNLATSLTNTSGYSLGRVRMCKAAEVAVFSQAVHDYQYYIFSK